MSICEECLTKQAELVHKDVFPGIDEKTIAAIMEYTIRFHFETYCKHLAEIRERGAFHFMAEDKRTKGLRSHCGKVKVSPRWTKKASP